MTASSPMPARAAATARSSPTIKRGAHEQLGDVGGAPAGGGGTGGGFEAVDADRRAVEHDVVGVEAAVGDPRRVQRTRPAARGR